MLIVSLVSLTSDLAESVALIVTPSVLTVVLPATSSVVVTLSAAIIVAVSPEPTVTRSKPESLDDNLTLKPLAPSLTTPILPSVKVSVAPPVTLKASALPTSIVSPVSLINSRLAF